MNELSAVIISRNEADRIGRCIDSVRDIVQEIIVIDSGSTDDTVAIARQHGATVYEVSWMGYGANKNLGAQYSKTSWILSLDSDEWLSSDLAEEIRGLQLHRSTVCHMDRVNHYLGATIRYSGWSPDWVARLYHREDAQWNDSYVHEKLVHDRDAKILQLSGKIHHDSYRSIEEHVYKTIQYATLKAQSWIDTQTSPSVPKRIFGAFWKAFRSYVLKMGFLDGKAGWQIAKMNAFLVRQQIKQYDRLKKSKT